MTAPLVRAALRNYVSPVFVRDNMVIVAAGLDVTAMLICLKSAARVVAHGGVRALLSHQSIFQTVWWMVAFLVPNAVTTHYWRQIKSNLATAIPDLAAAERAAVSIMLAGVFLLLALPFLWLGAPVWGTLALTSIGLVMGGGTTAAPGAHRVVSVLRALLIAPIMLVGFAPGYLAMIMFAPPRLDAAIVLAIGVVMAAGLYYRPAQAAQQGEDVERRIDRAVGRRAVTRRPSVVFNGIRRLLFWKPWFLSDLPLPAALNLPLGPIGIGVSITAMTALFTLSMSVVSWITGNGFVHAAMTQGRQTLGIGISLTLLAGGQWLLNRDDWPVLFMAGRYGGRQGFCRSMIRAHCSNIIQSSLWCGVVGAAGGVLFGAMRPDQAPLAAIAVFGIMFGMSFAPGLPLLWRERGGKAATFAANYAGYMIALMTFQTLIMRHGPTTLSLIIAAAAMIFGIVMLRFIPARLAVMDWPIGAVTVDMR